MNARRNLLKSAACVALGRVGLAALALACVAFVAAVPPASAARFHVLVDGTRTAGASVPSDWTQANCYPRLALALQAASDADTVLLSREDHRLDAAVALRALLANRDLDAQPDLCRVVLGTVGTLTVAAAATEATLRGLTFAAAETASTQPAVQIAGHTTPGAVVAVEACRFTGLAANPGSSTGGSALNIGPGSVTLAVTITDCTFQSCSGGRMGGAVYAGDGVELTLQRCTLDDNEAQWTGGALGGAVALLGGSAGGSLTVEECTFSGNRSMGPGGGLFVQDAELVMRDTDVLDNRSAWGATTNWSAGAGLFMRRTLAGPDPLNVLLERCRFNGNRGDLAIDPYAGDGGGVLMRGSETGSLLEFVLRDCRFTGNYNAQGGGLFVGRWATGTVERCIFTDNTVFSAGGAAFKGGQYPENLGETVLFSYCLFVGNRAGWSQDDEPLGGYGMGGAFMTRLQPRAEFHNCTFADNLCGPVSVHQGDALYHWDEGMGFTDDLQRCRLVNCLFYGVTGNDVQVRSDAGGFSEVLNCAWEPAEFICAGFTPTGTVTLSGSPFSPGGDWRLADGSLCIDAAVPLGYTIDLAGTAIPQGIAPDIGAYERLYQVGVGDDPEIARATGKPMLRLVHPNPANPRAVVSFALVRPGFVRLTVHDIAGRQVAILTEAEYTAGEHAVSWDGRDQSGAAVASGLYAMRLAADGAVATQKVMLVR